MKDIKTMMIGFLLATCMFLMMGNTNYVKETNNKFEIHMENGDTTAGFLLNTETGDTWYLWKKEKNKHKN